ncbi:hypothetical protein TL16_g09390 [Triparma laevis f. inornata]|uniref:Uncharacterized protein n=1 Tax=Triparma laevis f. inornata TaxID=1714386 RepID=A0A9W7EKV7_9STRA|nr:hypothetical protein TL16_g09390 [Triparma laevis f. inornata]
MRRFMLIALIFAALVAPGHQLSLRPLSVPVMTGGASLAKAGERIVSITERPPLECYGGALSACGASLRNAGDCMGQCGATCKNKFGMEIAGDEAREAAVCLDEATAKMRTWIEEENDTDIKVMVDICDGLSTASNCAEMMGRIMYSQLHWHKLKPEPRLQIKPELHWHKLKPEPRLQVHPPQPLGVAKVYTSASRFRLSIKSLKKSTSNMLSPQVTSKGGKEVEAKDKAGLVKYLLLLSESLVLIASRLDESELASVKDGKEMIGYLREASDKFGEGGKVMRDGEVERGGLIVFQ